MNEFEILKRRMDDLEQKLKDHEERAWAHDVVIGSAKSKKDGKRICRHCGHVQRKWMADKCFCEVCGADIEKS